MTVSVPMAEEVAMFAARRALASGAINRAFVETLHQLCQSDRAAIREHAVLLAHQAAAIEWTRRQNGSAA
jgi:hypothetical protein